MVHVHVIIGIYVAQDPLVWQVLDLVYGFSTQTLRFFVFFTEDSMALLIMATFKRYGLYQIIFFRSDFGKIPCSCLLDFLAFSVGLLLVSNFDL